MVLELSDDVALTLAQHGILKLEVFEITGPNTGQFDPDNYFL